MANLWLDWRFLPQWQQEMWGNELRALGNNYCMIPDRVYEGKETARYTRQLGAEADASLVDVMKKEGIEVNTANVKSFPFAITRALRTSFESSCINIKSFDS